MSSEADERPRDPDLESAAHKRRDKERLWRNAAAFPLVAGMLVVLAVAVWVITR